jgi:hypothetical protein
MRFMLRRRTRSGRRAAAVVEPERFHRLALIDELDGQQAARPKVFATDVGPS